jgi:hypothetical protein
MSSTTFPDPAPHPQAAGLAVARSVARHDPEAETTARQLLAEAKIAAYVEKVVATAPPLHPVQRERLCTLLAEVGGA